MRIGDLRHRVQLQYPIRTTDAMGGFSVVWTDDAEVWAAIWPVSATEQIQSAQQVMTITHRIRLRYHATINASWRVKFGTRYFSIVSLINPNEKGAMLELLVKEATA